MIILHPTRESASSRRVTPSLAVLGMLTIAGPHSVGQETLWDWTGQSADDNFGWPAATGGDLDADGIGDIVVASTNYGAGNPQGRVYAYSGSTGHRLFTWTGAGGADVFGFALAIAGDIDGDSHDDVLIGAPWKSSNGAQSGRVYLYSGRDGTVLQTFDGDADGYLGYGLAGLGDLNGDAWPDFVMSEPGAGSPQTGAVHVYSGRDYSLLGSVTGEGSPDEFGFAIAVCRDLDGDQCDDLVIGAACHDGNGADAGRVYVVSGKSLAWLYTLDGEEAGARFGFSVAAFQDFDGDGREDFIVGAKDQDTTQFGAGRVYVFSSATGVPLWTIDGEYLGGVLGVSVANGGDCNADGIQDLIVGASSAPGVDESPEGEAYLYSGRTRRLLYRFRGENTGDGFGYPVRGATDLDGDDIDDLLVSAPWHDDPFQTAGRTTVFAGNDLFLQVEPSVALAGDLVSAVTRGGVPGAPVALVAVEVNGVPTWTLLALSWLDANGEFTLSGTVPSGYSGQSVSLQSFSIGWRGRVADSAVATLSFQ